MLVILSTRSAIHPERPRRRRSFGAVPITISSTFRARNVRQDDFVDGACLNSDSNLLAGGVGQRTKLTKKFHTLSGAPV